MATVTTLLLAVSRALLATLVQLLVVLGPLLALGLLMHWVAGVLERAAERLVGRRAYLYLIGWAGTTVHELSHAAACLLFRHRITALKLFDPAARDGTHGYVRHSFDPASPYQRIGNFFIGVAPLLGGTLALYAAARLLFGGAVDLSAAVPWDATALPWGDASAVGPAVAEALRAMLASAVAVCTSAAALPWRLPLFVVVVLAVGGAMRLSPADLAGARSGFVALVAVLLLAQLLAMGVLAMAPHAAPAFHVAAQRAAHVMARGAGALQALMLGALVLNAGLAALATMLALAFTRRA